MAPILWPPGLPQAPIMDRYSKELPELVLRSSVDAGYDKLRRRFTAGPVKHSVVLKLTRTQVALLQTFYLDTTKAGTEPFTWRDHETGDDADFRFFSKPTIKPRAPRQDGSEFWETDVFVLEQLPAEVSDDDDDPPADPPGADIYNLDAEPESVPEPEGEAELTGAVPTAAVPDAGYFPWIVDIFGDGEPDSSSIETDLERLYGEVATTCGSSTSSDQSAFMSGRNVHQLDVIGGIYVDC